MFEPLSKVYADADWSFHLTNYDTYTPAAPATQAPTTTTAAAMNDVVESDVAVKVVTDVVWVTVTA